VIPRSSGRLTNVCTKPARNLRFYQYLRGHCDGFCYDLADSTPSCLARRITVADLRGYGNLGGLSRCRQPAKSGLDHFSTAFWPGAPSVSRQHSAPGCFWMRSARYAAGFTTCPRNRMAPLSMSRIRKTNGRSTFTSTGVPGAAVRSITTAVAAAASVPSSSTATNALW